MGGLAAVEQSPGRRVVLLEGETIGFGASSRNGGFADSSLTHGLGNGVAHWPDEIDDLVRIGQENLGGLIADIERLGVDADLTRSGELSLADAAWQAEELARGGRAAPGARHPRRVPRRGGRAAARCARRASLAGMYRPDDVVLVDPARLAAGLGDAVEGLGVTVHERSPVVGCRAATARA